MSSKGWIKLHRKVLDCWIWQEKPFDKGRAWVDLLLLAMHSDKKMLIDNEITVIERGSFMTSVLKLSERWGWSRNKVNRFLDVLEREQMLDTKRTSKGTLVTIVKYENYQVYDTQDDTTVGTPNDTPHGTTHDTPSETPDDTTDEPQNKNIKNEKNEENEKNIRVSKDTLCQTQDVRRVLQEWNTLSEYGIKSVSKVNSGSRRYQNLVARIKQYSVDDVLKAIDNIRHSDFLQGKHSGRPWQVTFDWFVLPNNFPKVLDGNYVDSKETTDLSIKGNTNLDEGPVDWTVV